MFNFCIGTGKHNTPAIAVAAPTPHARPNDSWVIFPNIFFPAAPANIFLGPSCFPVEYTRLLPCRNCSPLLLLCLTKFGCTGPLERRGHANTVRCDSSGLVTLASSAHTADAGRKVVSIRLSQVWLYLAGIQDGNTRHLPKNGCGAPERRRHGWMESYGSFHVPFAGNFSIF